MTVPTAPDLWHDSRRLTGANVFMERCGAVLDVPIDAADADIALALWTKHVTAMLRAVGWRGEQVHSRRWPGGASLAISAPFDALFAATDVNEWAWRAACRDIGRDTGAPGLSPGAVPATFDAAAKHLTALIAAERSAPLEALARVAASFGVPLVVDDEVVSLGAGSGGTRSWLRAALPRPDSVEWDDLGDIPVALVTGSNGKTTSVRLVAAMITAAGRRAGLSSTDGVMIAGEYVTRGDWSGPQGARTVLRDGRVDVAVLETARGGLLRRGLAVDRADAALITNVAADHFGEYGVHDLASLADVKLTVARVLGDHGRLVLNADDATLVSRASEVRAAITWFTLDRTNPFVVAHLAAGGTAAVVDGDALVLVHGRRRAIEVPVRDVPITLGGAAQHNVANALGALALGAALGLPPDAIVAGLTGLRGTTVDNPGRMNLFELGGVRAIIDYAHNPHGIAALMAAVRALAPRRTLLLVGQPGNRDDAGIRGAARAAWTATPDMIVVKELDQHLRGRAAGEVSAMLRDELRAAGAPPERVTAIDDELAAVAWALEWAQPGDVLALTVHGHRDRAIALLAGLVDAGWRAGDPVPRSAAIPDPGD